MDYKNRHNVVEGCNWLMVAVALGWIVYMFAGLLSSSPSDSQTMWSPPRVVPQRALPSTPAWGQANRTSAGPNQDTSTWGQANRTSAEPNQDTSSRPSRITASNSEGSLTESAPPLDLDMLWGDGAPYAVAPEGRVDPISPVHPVLGPDF